MSKRQAKYIVHGFVQGVGFRFFVYQKAKLLKLKGYAKNLWDGTVEVVAEGDSAALDILYNELKKGPSRADVSLVERNYYDYTGQFSGFDIL